MISQSICDDSEELRGVSRGKDAKDVDWSEVAATFDEAEEEENSKPAPIKIPVNELLAKVRKPSKSKVKAGLATIDTKSEYRKLFYIYYLYICSNHRVTLIMYDLKYLNRNLFFI